MASQYTAVITNEDGWYIARCLELPVTTQGKSIDEAQANIREAIELYIESVSNDELPATASEVMILHVKVATIS